MFSSLKTSCACATISSLVNGLIKNAVDSTGSLPNWSLQALRAVTVDLFLNVAHLALLRLGFQQPKYQNLVYFSKRLKERKVNFNKNNICLDLAGILFQGRCCRKHWRTDAIGISYPRLSMLLITVSRSLIHQVKSSL